MLTAISIPMEISSMQFVNMTPHSITIHKDSGRRTITLAPAHPGGIRLSELRENAGQLNGVQMDYCTYHPESGGGSLPRGKEGTMFIVSKMVMDAFPERHDLVRPGILIRDPDSGAITGCTTLSVSSAVASAVANAESVKDQVLATALGPRQSITEGLLSGGHALLLRKWASIIISDSDQCRTGAFIDDVVDEVRKDPSLEVAPDKAVFGWIVDAMVLRDGGLLAEVADKAVRYISDRGRHVDVVKIADVGYVAHLPSVAWGKEWTRRGPLSPTVGTAITQCFSSTEGTLEEGEPWHLREGVHHKSMEQFNLRAEEFVMRTDIGKHDPDVAWMLYGEAKLRMDS